IAAVMRLWRLGSPSSIISLDETFYVPDARSVLRFGTESDLRSPSQFLAVHPPVGKWFIAVGMKIFGDNPFGWRVMGALLGACAVLLIYWVCRPFWGHRWALLAAALLGIEGMWFVLSRIAMLDIYAGLFVLLAFALIVSQRFADAR